MGKITPEKKELVDGEEEQSTFSSIIDKITPDKKELAEGEEEQSTFSALLDKIPSFDKKEQPPKDENKKS